MILDRLKSVAEHTLPERFTRSSREAEAAAEGGRGLGWASIGIGLTEIFCAKQVQGMLGIEDRPMHRGILRMLGVREIMHGIGILTETKPTTQMTAGVWSRVAGDVLDTALLGVCAMKTKRPASFAAVATAVLGIGMADMYYAQKLARHHDGSND